jgi:hypothetical protein
MRQEKLVSGTAMLRSIAIENAAGLGLQGLGLVRLGLQGLGLVRNKRYREDRASSRNHLGYPPPVFDRK